MTARLFLYNLLWRYFGLRRAGRALVDSLGSKDPNLRTIAGMILVKGGKKSELLLRDALQKRDNLPIVLTVLGSIGDPKLEPQLRQFIEDRDPNVAKAARHALDMVHFSPSKS